MSISHGHITPGLFGFMAELAENNDREWFAAHKSEYEDLVREPLRAFIRDVDGPLEAISPHIVVDDRKSGGSLFRIHRDIRFSKDKTPYKTHTGVQFRHQAGKDAHAPGFYVHLDSEGLFFGGGDTFRSLKMLSDQELIEPIRPEFKGGEEPTRSSRVATFVPT